MRGILNEEEVELARSGVGYLKGVHVVIATPDCLAQVLQLPEFASIFLDLKAVAIDEVDACFLVRTPNHSLDDPATIWYH